MLSAERMDTDSEVQADDRVNNETRSRSIVSNYCGTTKLADQTNATCRRRITTAQRNTRVCCATVVGLRNFTQVTANFYRICNCVLREWTQLQRVTAIHSSVYVPYQCINGYHTTTNQQSRTWRLRHNDVNARPRPLASLRRCTPTHWTEQSAV